MQFIKNYWWIILVAGLVIVGGSVYLLSQNSSNSLPVYTQPDVEAGIQETPTLTTTTTSSPVPTIKIDLGTVITPYVSESDVSSVNEAYSLNANNPYWGFAHSGVDFMSTKDIQVQAVIDGTIGNIETAKADGQMGWHTSMCINRGNDAACYNLETFSSNQAIGDRQKAGVKVNNGDRVKKGDVLATLVYGGKGTHIDFGIITDNNRVCPEPYFTSEAKESVLKLIHKDHPSWKMCTE